MIVRIWHGWTTAENADIYERLLHTRVLPGIAAKGVAGYLGAEVLRREVPSGAEFVTILRFESLQDVKRFAGEDHEVAYVPAEARAVLERFDARAQHYELREPGPDHVSADRVSAD